MKLFGLTWDQWKLVIFGASLMLIPSLIVLAILLIPPRRKRDGD